MSEVKKISPVGNIYGWEESQFGEFVLSQDYDDLADEAQALRGEVAALRAKLAMAEDAAAKGDAARQQCGGMEMEIEELRAELETLRARVVVVPERELFTQYLPGAIPRNADEVSAWKEGWNACLDELARLNGKTVSASALDTLRRFATGEVKHLNNGHCPDDLEGRETRDPNCSVCRALIETEKENGNG